MATETGIPVDSENKAKKLKLLSVARPHMRAFHLSWFAFFVCFTSTFAAPPLLPIIRDNLDLTKKDVANAGIASVTGSVVSRLAMGALCDIVGPRYATSSLIMLTAPAVFCMSLVTSATGFILVRFFIGFSLATFVSTQFWMSSMFSSSTVGFANGLAGGWGNAGGGATQLLMPLLYDLIHSIIGCTPFTAWRLAFFIPGTFHILMGIVVLVLTQDLPDGNYEQLTQRGDKVADSFTEVFRAGVGNYRTWILGITYGYCFGVELTVDNVIAQYFYDRFSLNLGTAGIIAASFGLANVFSRPAGGVLSDSVSRKFGMRGRMWALWIFQTVGGLLCVALGKSDSLVVAIIVMVTFSVFVQSACGLTFGIVPFVSRRALGIVSGMTGAGGNVGAIVTQLMFFTSSAYSEEQGITYMGFMMLACTVPVALLYFPQWGGIFCPASDKWEEETYYVSEWSVAERQQGLCKNALKFAENSRLERGQKKKLIVSLPTTNTINV